MTTSGVTTFSINRNEIIDLAFEDIKAYAMDFQTPPPAAYTRANKRLNLMIKAWQANGVGLWLNLPVTLPLKANAQFYTLGPTGDHCSASMIDTTVATSALSGDLSIVVADATGIINGQNIGIQLDDGTIQWTTVNGAPVGTTVALAAALTDSATADTNAVFAYTTGISRPLSIVEARLRDLSGNEIVMSPMSWDDYVQMPLKSSTGPVLQYCHKTETINSKMYVWPVGDVISSRIVMTLRTPVQDFVNATDTPDFPIEWSEALHYGLALRLLSVYDVPSKIAQYVIQMAALALQDADGFDREQNVSVKFVPDLEGY